MITRTEKRCGDEVVRDWVDTFPNVHRAELASGLSKGHLRLWLDDPDRGLMPDYALKLAQSAGVPVEAILFRWRKIHQLDMWRWVKKAA